MSDSNTSNNYNSVSETIDATEKMSFENNNDYDNSAISVISDDDVQNNDDEAPTILQDCNREMKLIRQMRLESLQWSVFNLFIFKYDGLNHPEDSELYQYWSGRGGVGPKIKKDLDLPRTYSVKERMLPIFERILECFKLGLKFQPSSVDCRGGNQPITIRMDSYEAQIIADGMESGLSVHRV